MNNILVFDIETAGAKFSELDEYSQELLTKRFNKRAQSPEEAEQLKETLAFYPVTAQVVAIAMLNADTGKGMVLFQQKEKSAAFEEQEAKFETFGNEAALLNKFWEVSASYNEYVTFNGRGFDVPFLMIRSAINEIRPAKNLMVNRYAESQPFNLKHIDLAEQFSYYGAKNDYLGLHFWANAFGVQSPKTDEINGDKVTEMFRQGKTLEIAKYCLRDVRSTLEIYKKWNKYLRFF